MTELQAFLDQLKDGDTAAVGVAVMLVASMVTWLAITLRALYRFLDIVGQPRQTALARLDRKKYHSVGAAAPYGFIGDVLVEGSSDAESVTFTVTLGGQQVSADFTIDYDSRIPVQLAQRAYVRYVTGRFSGKPQVVGITPA